MPVILFKLEQHFTAIENIDTHTWFLQRWYFVTLLKVHVVLLFEDFFEVWQCHAWNFLQIGLHVFL